MRYPDLAKRLPFCTNARAQARAWTVPPAIGQAHDIASEAEYCALQVLDRGARGQALAALIVRRPTTHLCYSVYIPGVLAVRTTSDSLICTVVNGTGFRQQSLARVFTGATAYKCILNFRVSYRMHTTAPFPD